MRVLHVFRDYFTQVPGGIERYVYEIVHSMKTQISPEVSVSGKRGLKSWVDGDVPVHVSRELVRIQGVPLSPNLMRRVSDTRYDVIHVHSPYPTGEMALLSSRSRARRFVTYHADLDRGARLFPVYRRFLKLVYSRCEKVLASSARLVEASRVLSDFKERRPDALEIVPMGVDTERFRPEATGRSEQLRAQTGGPLVLFVGRLRYYKGLPVLIRAMREIEAHLMIVGGGPFRDKIVRLGSELLGSRFIHANYAHEDELADLYRAADVFCLPSTSHAETFGLAAVEAMSCGTPVITTEVGTATSEINIDGQTGYVVPPRDHLALMAAIEKVLSDPQKAAEMGSAARRRVLDRYDRTAMVQRLVELYQGEGK